MEENRVDISNGLWQLNLCSELSESRRSSIEDALRNFKETVLKQNLATLRILLDAAKNEGRAASEEYPEDEIEEAYERLFSEAYQVDFADAEAVLLESSADLVSPYWLDGIEHETVDLEAREQWWASIQSAIDAHQQDINPLPESLPADLRYSTTLVNAISGPGLPYWRMQQQKDLLPAVDLRNGHRQICIPSLGNWQDVAAFRPEDVMDHNNAVGYTWCREGLEVSVAINVSRWPTSDGDGMFALFCQSGSGEWMWRYGFQQGTYNSGLLDTVEGLLGWWAHFREQTEENIIPEELSFD